jgi:hypothetical protein
MTYDGKWQDSFDKLPVTGSCDGGCGKPATTWFGRTSCATCGDSACVKVLQDSYDREGEVPDFGHVQPQPAWPRPTLEHELHEALAKIAGLEEWVENLQLDRAGFKATAGVLAAELRRAEDRIAVLEAAVRANHEWHRAYDEHGGYAKSGLDQTNLAALYAQADPERDQKIADWHEGRAGLDQELHEYLGLSWAEYAQWASPRPRPHPALAIVLEKVDDLCERFELEGLHSHPTYKQFKRLFAELAALKTEPRSEP